MSLREDQVEAALRFLGNEKVKDRPPDEKRDFLLNKGLTEAEIAEAVRRFESNGGATSTAPPTPSTGGATTAPTPSYPMPPPQVPPPYGGGGYPGMPPQGYPGAGGMPLQGYPGMPPQGYPGMPPQGYPGMPPQGYLGASPYDVPQSGGSVPGWLWGLGGAAAGLGLTLMARNFGQNQQEKMVQGGFDGQAGWGQQQQLQGQLQLPSADIQALENSNAIKPDTSDSSPATKAGAEGGEKTEKDTKEVYEDLLALLRQHGDESKETSAVFRKGLSQWQEQYQVMFAEMQKTLTAQTQQTKVQKSLPTDLSAATLQSLAALIDGAKSGAQPATEGGEAPSAATNAGNAALNPLRESLDVISQNLNRLVNESTSKVEASKRLNTLSMLLTNLLGAPSEAKNRKVNTSSNRFAALAQGPSAELLKLAGFELQGQSFVLAPEQTVEAAERVQDLLGSKQRTLDEDWEARPAENGAGTAGVAAGTGSDDRQEDDPAICQNSVNPVQAANTAPTLPQCLQPIVGKEQAAVSSDDTSALPFQSPTTVPSMGSGKGKGSGNGMIPGVNATTTANTTHVSNTMEGVNDGIRRSLPVRPWEAAAAAQRATAVAPARPWETASVPVAPTAQSSGSAVPEAGGGEDDTQLSPSQHAPAPSQVATPVAQTIAHPAESAGTGQGQAMAHPAQSAEQGIAHPAQSAESPVAGQAMAHPAEAADLVQPPRVTELYHNLTQPAEVAMPQNDFQAANPVAMAHPAQVSTTSEEPQSGG